MLHVELYSIYRITYCEFDKSVVGPIYDEQGLEQGGVASSDCYKLYNNELLEMAQMSRLGVDMGGSLVLSAVGQADDTVLLSNDINKLMLIFQLAKNYCLKYNVQLSSSKTKLLKISPSRHETIVPFNPISMDGSEVKFVEQAEHVGVIRSTDGNMPNILQRLRSFKQGLGSVISCGLARGHRSNPTASLRILSMYGTPRLLSGLPSLVLSAKEISIIDQQYKRTLQSIMKLAVNSPPCLVHFLAGSLPGTAILHLRQLSLFVMICLLPGDPLHDQAIQVLLTSPSSSGSWFLQVRNLMLQYQLPHPLLLLTNPPNKKSCKHLIKSKVLDFWETKLRASFLPSLPYFQPQYLSLNSPHRLWTSAGVKSYEVAKARVQALFLSCQYPCAKLARHWSLTNPRGLCLYPRCHEKQEVESIEHILLYCPAYKQTRVKLISLCLRTKNHTTHKIVTNILLSGSETKIMQLLLDCSVIPDVISLAQLYGEDLYRDIFYLGRTWCYSIYRDHMKRLGKWNFR